MEQSGVSMKSHRGTLILVFGILSIVLPFFGIGIIFGIVALVLAGKDMKMMRSGQMDPSGTSLVKAGKVCAIVGVVCTGLIIILTLTAVGVPIFMRYSEEASVAEAQTAIRSIRNAYNIHKQQFGTTEDYSIKDALQDTKLSTDITRKWEFEVIGEPPRKYIATSTAEHPAGEGHQMTYDVDDAVFYGWGIEYTGED